MSSQPWTTIAQLEMSLDEARREIGALQSKRAAAVQEAFERAAKVAEATFPYPHEYQIPAEEIAEAIRKLI